MTFKDFAKMNSHLESVNQIILCAIGKWSTQQYLYSGISDVGGYSIISILLISAVTHFAQLV